MNFFQSQARARNQTKTLVLLFVLAVFSLILLTNLLVMGLFGYFSLEGQAISLDYIKHQFDWQRFLIISAVVIIFVAIGSVYKLMSLRQGGRVVAEALGGTLINQNTDNLQYRVLLNVVEEMAIASGTPVPLVFVLKDESAINAFAAGFSIKDAVIGVTQGALDCFSRDELQGVIAHEFSHIVNGDMRINLRLMGILHGIMLLGLLGYYIMRVSGSSSRSKDSGKLVFLGLGLVVIGYGGMFFGNAIKASVSRQREYLADASAVQFTRDNQGIANALKKIGGYNKGSKLESPEAQSISHAFFSNALTNKFTSLFATHPPLPKRIKQIEPNWSGKFETVKVTNRPLLLEGEASGVSHFSESNAELDMSPSTHNLLEGVGQVSISNVTLAKNHLAAIPKSIRDLVHNNQGAEAFVYALLLTDNSSDKTFVEKQRLYLQKRLPNPLFELIEEHFQGVAELRIEHRLPLLEMALPQLRGMPESRYEAMLEQMRYLVFTDNTQSIFEWAISNIVASYLQTEFEHADQRQVKYKSTAVVQQHIEVCLSMLLYEFCDTGEHAIIIQKANEMLGLRTLSLLPLDKLNIEDFSKALQALSKLAPEPKEKVLQTCIFAVTQDHHYSPQEHETIRAMADCLDCPMPIRV
ncbi:M48 family metallopeptidase [uncultured Paraglaciecola sp.]|uniref:M48 family metallopeptidase n=1 Tax=uncultured Paraglaciecola sp. TaxID=1765024 RepID=UPI0030DCE24A|tara:strand:+ start:59042 stop:60955 length:1914 start_codon:yes stop_codon:yes gene_type:complete